MQGDMRLRLRDVLAQLSERDSVVPAEPMRLRTPLIMAASRAGEVAPPHAAAMRGARCEQRACAGGRLQPQ